MAAVARVFDNPALARHAIQALQAAGIDPSLISVLTRAPRDAEVLEHDSGVSGDLEDASLHRRPLETLADWLGRVEAVVVPGYGSVLGSGDLWQDIAVGGTGRGSVTGALVGVGLPVDEAARLEESVMAGRVLLVVHGSYDATAVERAFASADQLT